MYLKKRVEEYICNLWWKRWGNLPNQGVVFFTGKVRVEIGMRKKITALLPPCCFSGFPEYRTNRKWYGGRGIPSGGSGRCRFPAVLLAVFDESLRQCVVLMQERVPFRQSFADDFRACLAISDGSQAVGSDAVCYQVFHH